MKLCITVFCLALYMQCQGQYYVSELRGCLEKVKNDKEYAFAVYDKLEQANLSNLENGYFGVIESMLANHTFDPLKKITYFNAGKNKLENTINQSPTNTELRYLRLMVQLNVPSLLGYSSYIESDRTFIIQNIAAQKSELGNLQYQRMIENLIFNGKCSKSQIIQLHQLKSE